MKIIKIAQTNVTLPPGREINSGVTYISSNRLTKVIPRENVNREYIVRLYRYDDGMYSVIGWNGRRGGTLRPQPKYFGNDRRTALNIVGQVISEKRMHGYDEDPEAYHGPSSRSYMGRYQNVNDSSPDGNTRITTPTSPSAPSERPSRTPSIRLQSEYIPNQSSIYNTAILMRQGNREFLIMVYDYRNGYYSTIEWYSPDGREWRIHPKLVTSHIADALSMATRLREEKLREDWAQEMEPAQIDNALRSLDRGRSIQDAPPPAQTVPLSPDLNTFISNITQNQQGAIGGYWYRVASMSGQTLWITAEYFEEDHNHLVREERFDNIEDAIRQAAMWGQQRERNPRFPRASTPSPTPVQQVKETPSKPFAEYRMPIEDEEEDDVLGHTSTNMQKVSSNNWYVKTSKSISGELRGYFKFIAEASNSTLVHNVWWEGLGDNVAITKHDLSGEDYDKYKDTIKATAKKNSLKAYKDLADTLK